MKAIIMAFSQEGTNVLSRAKGILTERDVAIVNSGTSVVGGRLCFAAIVDAGGRTTNFKNFQESIKSEGNSAGLEIKVMRPNLFLSMHRIAPTALEPIT